nr:MAG TPA: protein of unknown function (DUF4969) [Caudoviricetes sp.]
MKKKIAAIIVALSMCVGMTGCSEKVRNGNCNFTYVDNEYIHLITVCDRGDGNVIAYDENTKVLYLCVYGYSTMGITPIYNSDGSLKLYEK